MLEMVRSGAQTGSDQGGLRAAKRFGFKTGGMIPKGCVTEDGPRPEFLELYGLVESKSSTYPPRTFDNVKSSDGTIRLAFNFGTPGEVLTLKAIKQYNRPYIDVDVVNPIRHEDVADWIIENDIKVLNVAGNAESKFAGIADFVEEYLLAVFTLLRERDFVRHTGESL